MARSVRRPPSVRFVTRRRSPDPPGLVPATARTPSAPSGYVVRLALWRVRRALPALGVVVAVLVVVRALAGPPDETTTVAVLARDVPAGHVLDARDVRVARLPPSTVPDGALADPGAATGTAVLLDLPRGMPLVDGLLARGRFGVEPPAGTVVVPLELAGVTDLLRPGDRVDVVARTDGTGAGAGAGADEVLAAGALVLSVETGEAAGGGSLLGAPGSADPVVTVVAVPPEDGRRLVAHSGWDPLGAVLVP